MGLPVVAFVPLDDRPPNYEYPALLAEAAGFQPVLPPKEWLGTPWRTGELDKLAAWTRAIAAQADALIVAVDTLGYGGLITSRQSSEPAGSVLGRLHLLRQLKADHPDLTLLAYSVLMRISRANSAEEEKGYWEAYGARLFRMSHLEDRLGMMAGEPGDEELLARLSAEVPQEIVTDYLQGRARNHTVNRAMIEWTADGIFDYLIIPQDDTVEYGWNIAERRQLQRLVRQLGLADRVSIYPGADETAMLLLARYAAQRVGFAPAVAPRYSSVRAGSVITAYEDRPMAELIKAYLGPLDGALATAPTDANLVLYVNTPAETQGDGNEQYPILLSHDDLYELHPATTDALQETLRTPELQNTLREMNSVQRDVNEFARGLARDMAGGRLCAVVDVAFVNGADLALSDALLRRVNIAQLAGYGGWNTAGNTLGSVLAMAVIRAIQLEHGATHAQLAAHTRFLFTRFVDDYLYQGIVRAQVAFELLPPLGIAPKMSYLGAAAGTVQGEVAARLAAVAGALADSHFAGHTLQAGTETLTIERPQVTHVVLPWRRLFEVGFTVML